LRERKTALFEPDSRLYTVILNNFQRIPLGFIQEGKRSFLAPFDT
jgi:hypothetical protein